MSNDKVRDESMIEVPQIHLSHDDYVRIDRKIRDIKPEEYRKDIIKWMLEDIHDPELLKKISDLVMYYQTVECIYNNPEDYGSFSDGMSREIAEHKAIAELNIRIQMTEEPYDPGG